ncbi:Crp/Fnr family transcriptional regulator [Tenacibaculum agarivorans]|uniref:Crp/Fnr family transcriptional regulator n=1 Tax=Tenacibaculum agarivorans TaxID=1908389 RepID=UPI00094BBCA4|nr:Crp/Fnr family transcriptional regulator [Tenacibaculum agarivorans]
MKQNIYDVLHRLFLISPQQFEPLKNILKTKKYSKGDIILNQGEIDRQYSFVASGIVHQYIMVDDYVYTIDIKISGMFFNALKSYLEEIPSNEVQEAVTDVELIYFYKEDFEKLFTLPIFSLIYIRSIETSFLRRENRSFILQHLSASDRFKLFMEMDINAQRFLLEIPQKLLASYLAMTPPTFSKIKKEYFQRN